MATTTAFQTATAASSQDAPITLASTPTGGTETKGEAISPVSNGGVFID